MNHAYDELPHFAIERALSSGQPVVAILPIGATESHGPHLPLNTDVIISRGIANRCAAILEKKKITAFVLPPLAYTPADYAAEFAGTIGVRQATMAAMLDDIGISLKGQGFACLAFANSHFDPANVAVLREAATRIETSGLVVAFADATRRSLAEKLTDEFRSGDCHGGQFETSIVLAEAPHLVDRAALRALMPVRVGLVEAIKKGGQATFKALGMAHSYCGSPANATKEEGERSLAILGQALADAVMVRFDDPLAS